MGSSAILLLFLLLLFHDIHISAAPPLFLPLKAQKLPVGSSSSGTNELFFRHNVSLLVSLSIGSPPQNVSMVLDTGSELSFLQCSNSTFPNSNASAFLPCLSSTFARVPCSAPTCISQTHDLPSPAFCDSSSSCLVSVSYADGSSSDGSLSTDTFHVGNSAPFTAAFACTPTSPDQEAPSGLLGMNRGTLSLVSQMGTPRFSYCISDSTAPGVLLLGDPPFPVPFNYTPLIHPRLPLPYFDRVAYSVQLLGIRVGDISLQIPKWVLVPDHTGAGQTMVDSGTRFTFLLGPAYEALKEELLRRTTGVLAPLNEPDFVYQGAFDLCYRVPLSSSSLGRILPPVTLVLQGAEVRVDGEKLLHRVEGEQRGGDAIWCSTFGNSDLVPLEAYIIGHHHQENLWVEYDLEKGRVGFAAVRCDLACQRLSALV